MDEEINDVEAQEESTDGGYEERAMEMGWVPKDEFRGDESKWTDAKTFVERGENYIGIVRKERDELREQTRALRDEMTEMKRTFTEFGKFHRQTVEQTQKQAYEQARQELLQKQIRAAEDGDIDAFNELEKKKEELKPPSGSQAEKASEPQTDPHFEAFVKENTWYQDDPAMQAFADSMGEYISRVKPHLVGKGKAFYDAVAEEVKSRMPDQFQPPPPTAVNEGGMNRVTKKAKTFANLPSDAKQACESFVRQGLMTKEQYLKTYAWDD